MKKIIVPVVVIAFAILTIYLVKTYIDGALYRNPAFACGNGRIEATEVSIATKISEKIEEIYVCEGDMVEPKQLLAKMQTNVLEANLAQAKAKKGQAEASLVSSKAMIHVRKMELESAKADVANKQTVFDNASKQFKRSSELLQSSAVSQQQYDNDQASMLSAKANLVSAQAAVQQAEAAVNAAQADAIGAEANIQAAEADIASIESDLKDCYLYAPRMGRIQYRVAEPGEVLDKGGRVLNLADLTDVYITFFLDEETAGKVAIGADVRILLDIAPDQPIPAKVTYVSSVAQFTPKTVETKEERQKLMFRIKAHIAPALLKKFINTVKTGLPGVAWVRLDPKAEWPKELALTPDVEKKYKELLENDMQLPASASTEAKAAFEKKQQEMKAKEVPAGTPAEKAAPAGK